MAAIFRGLVLSHDRNLVVENGGHLSFSNGWARRIIYKVTKDKKKMVSRLGNTAAMPTAPAILSKINFDQTLLVYICGYNRTMEFEGTTNVPIVGKGKKTTDNWAIYGY